MTSPAIREWLPCHRIGSGSSALVHLAISLPDGLPFALKSSISPASSPSLRNELRLLLHLSSPFVIRCFGAEFDSSNPSTLCHVFLEFMEGGSLSDLLKRSGGRIGELPARLYIRSIVRGLEYLHNNGIVHCDIKSQNILIGSSGVKIADFGAARRNSRYAGKLEQLRGTPLWMAPEVVQGIEQGFPSDIWSLGCTVVEMLQGRPPFGYISDMSAALFKIACSEEDPPLPESISDDAKDFLSHCLQRNPEERWTASQLLQHPFLHDLPPENAPKYEQLSPRSNLDLLTLDTNTSEDESYRSDLPDSLQSVAAQETIEACSNASSAHWSFDDVVHDLTERRWITVRSAGTSGKNTKQMPFMKSGHMSVTKGCDVTLKASEFLRRREILQ